FLNYPVNQFYGVQSELPAFMTGIQPLRGRGDAEHYAERVGRFGAAFDQVIEGLELRERLGIVPPRFVIDRVLAQTRALAAAPPNADACYAHLLRSYTTTGMSADRIHARGLAEVARIQGEMRAILAAQGIEARDLGATLRRLGREPRFRYPPGDSGRARILAD